MSVSEDEAVGTTVLHLTATDADYTHENTELEYNIISSSSSSSSSSTSSRDDEGRRCFRVTETSGELILVSALDRERTDHYELTLTASDRGQPSLTTTVNVSTFLHHYLYVI